MVSCLRSPFRCTQNDFEVVFEFGLTHELLERCRTQAVLVKVDLDLFFANSASSPSLSPNP